MWDRRTTKYLKALRPGIIAGLDTKARVRTVVLFIERKKKTP